MNLGPLETRKRLILGVSFLFISVMHAFWLLQFPDNLSWRVSLFLPLFFSFFCILEARKNTCVVLSEMGKCNMDGGTEPLQNSDMVRKIKKIGRRLLAQSFIYSAVLTYIFYKI